MRDLTLDEPLDPAQLLGAQLWCAQQMRGVAQGCQRIAQLVRQGGQELVLAPVGLAPRALTLGLVQQVLLANLPTAQGEIKALFAQMSWDRSCTSCAS
ncbi:hypothetical protein [Azohydromonas australica]|uniref:hypothetical protein n=1 Tax=Azohydromonas australica TaxID=364039 RepID=UPI0003F954F3|nr:hypothetical protein [Azohydromonas australica]